MIQIGSSIVSLDIIEKEFVCDITKCKGICCIEGDSGAPINDDEIAVITKHLDKILPFLSTQNKNILKKNGVFYIDEEGEKVTTLVNNAECAFVVNEGGILSCAIEQAWKQGLVPIPKPISCHLYPIRCRQYRDFEGLNYDTWHICKDAVCKGKNEKVKVYQFLKTSLIRKYGENWYQELEAVALQWERDKRAEGRK
jgi:hypothetical protein